MPAFPFHGWMPDGYRNMPLPVLAVFSAVLSKVAAYGFLRIVLPVFPDATDDFQLVMLLIGLASILYGSAQAFTQTNTRLILGYSSVAQLGFITLGIFALGQAAGAQGALLQMVQHGLVVAPLFFIIALLHERTGSDDIREMGGVAFRAPVLATLFLIVALATLAMPGSANFAGEFLILLGLFNSEMVIAIIAFTGVAMASVYMLRFFIRAMHNRLKAESGSYDIGVRDGLVLVPARARHPRVRGLPAAGAGALARRTVERVVGAPAAEAVAQRGGHAMMVFAAEQVQGPEIDWLAISPLMALIGGACLVLMAGLLRAPFVRHTIVPLLTLIALGACAGLTIATWGDNVSVIADAMVMDDLTLYPHAAVRGGGDRRRAAVVARDRAARGGARRVLRAAADGRGAA